MNVISFFTHLKQFNFNIQSPVIYITSKAYPILFFAICKKILQQEEVLIQTIDVHLLEEASIYAQLEVTFLSVRTIYWFVGMDQLDEKKKLKLLNYCKTYKGPHVIIMALNVAPDDLYNKGPIELDTIDRTTFNELATLFYPMHAKRSIQLSTSIFNQNKFISFDTAWLLIHYTILLGSSTDTFVSHWLSNIVEPERSLFTLSSAFFAKKEQLFFDLWQTIKEDFPMTFWTTYWSELLTRAALYIILMKQHNVIEAKKAAYRLPFSFIQKDWKSINLRQLQKAHKLLYSIDYNNKNGMGIYGFEILCAQFFNDNRPTIQ